MKNYDEVVREAEAFKDTQQEIEGLVPVRARLSENPGVVYSLRLSRAEMDRISEAAGRQGVKVSAFLRMAALAAAEQAISPEEAAKAAALQEVREKTRDLADAVSRL
jgi:hypothetical protein